MRRGFLGSIAALAAGAGAAWGEAPMPVAPAGEPPAAVGLAGDVIPAQGPAPVIMPPVAVGPPTDPLGLGPTATLGPPPGPMYPVPGPYAAPLFQPPPPPMPEHGRGGSGNYGSAPRWWMEGEYLLLFPSRQPINFPLLTTSAPNQNGILGLPTTTQIIGDKDIDYGVVNGFRLTTGFFGDNDRRFGFNMTGMYTEQVTFRERFRADGSLGVPVLARPFIDTTVGPTSLVVVSPSISGSIPNANGTTIGAASLTSYTGLWSLEPSGVLNLFRSEPCNKWWMSLDVMLGYKYLELAEDLRFSTTSLLNGVTVTPIPGGPPGPFGVPGPGGGNRIVPTQVGVGGLVINSPVHVTITDKVHALNRFNGGTVAFRSQIRYGMFSLNTVGKLGFGQNHQTLRIRGLTYFENQFTQQSGFSVAGLYANASNIGTYSHDDFSVIPELNMTLNVNLTRSLSMFIGYNFLYMNKVLRPGNQFNPFIDASTVPFSTTYGSTTGVPATPILFVQDDYWMHGITAGFGFRF